MIKTISAFLVIFAISMSTAREKMPKPPLNKGLWAAKVDHSAWNDLLRKHVDDQGNVNYANFKKDKKALASYLEHLSKNIPSTNWSRSDSLAYHINLYNAATVHLVISHYPVKSIKNIKKPWGKPRVKIGKKHYSLSDIEHRVLRKMNEPRIHFAINCASYSCPKLNNQAYTSALIESQLEEATLEFINDPKRNRITSQTLALSKIFKWYKKDFIENGTLAQYIDPYIEINIDSKTSIDYLKYDWNLNDTK